MNVYDYFIHCEKEMPNKVTPLRRTSFALRRAGVATMDQLCEMQTQASEELAHLRDIGIQSLAIINEVIGFCGGERMKEAADKKLYLKQDLF